MLPTWRRDAAAVAVCIALAWLGLRGQRVPLLALADLGFHELGHLVCYVLDAFLPWPEVVTAAAGSAAQVGVPLGLAGYFLVVRRDRVGGAVCLAWAATATADVARYVADAPVQALPLIGGHHDWATVLAGRLDLAAPIAAGLDRGAWVLLVAGVVTALWPATTTVTRRDEAAGTSCRRPRTRSVIR